MITDAVSLGGIGVKPAKARRNLALAPSESFQKKSHLGYTPSSGTPPRAPRNKTFLSIILLRTNIKKSFMILTQFWCFREQTTLDEPRGLFPIVTPLRRKREEGKELVLSASSGQTGSAHLLSLWLPGLEVVCISVSWDGRGLISITVQGPGLVLPSFGLLLLQSLSLLQLLLQKQCLCLVTSLIILSPPSATPHPLLWVAFCTQPQKMCWSPNRHHLRIWAYWEIGSLQR